MPILIAIGIAVAIILVMLVSQQSQIDELQRNDSFDDALNSCSQHLLDTEAMKECITNSFGNFGTPEEKQRWNDYLAELENKESSEQNFRKAVEQSCREEYIGQLDELTKCLDGAKLITDLP